MTLGSGQFTGQRAARPHLVRGSGGLSGEIADLRQDIIDDFAANACIALEVFTNPVVADPNGIKESFASAATDQDFSGSDLDGAVGTGVMDPPRNITITTSNNADINAVDVVITGTDINDQPLEDTITLTDDGNTTDVGVAAFKTVTRIQIPAQAGAGATIEVGFGALLGLAKPILSPAGVTSLIKEHAAGAVATNGVVAAASVGLPNGTYAPNSAPDGSRDYAIWYEYDASQNS